jgi:RNA polymerase sigma-70 factor (ECF subfamily)
VSASLVEPFLAGADDALREALSRRTDLDQRLSEIVAAAHAEWPDLAVPPAEFVAYVAARLPVDRDLDESLTTVRAGDLYLACACSRGDPQAVAGFDAKFMPELGAALGRMRLSASSLDEVKQLVRQKLFVADPGKRPKIADYSGRSGLRRWLRSVAVRTCLNFMRKGKREVLVEDDQVLAGVSSARDDPEIAYMKEKYRNEFRAAFQAALDAITPRQQSLLRYHYVDGLNIDEIGSIYRVHRVTAYRWLEKAREALINKTNELLKARLQVEKREFDSILRMIRSQLHVSLQRYLGEREPE